MREDEAVGSIVLPLAAYDGKVDDPTLTYTVNTVPTSAAGLFEIIGECRVTLQVYRDIVCVC